MKFIKKTNYYSGIVYEWNLPTGHSCPFAKECLVKVERNTGKFENKSGEYYCYASRSERFPAVREHRWKNYEFILSGGIPILPKNAKSIRIHASGDFFNQQYFDLWLKICVENPNVEFWAYTKSLKYWINRLDSIPKNLVLTASAGGRNDELINKYKLKHSIVVENKDLAIGMPIDYNDDIARMPNINFYLLDNTKNKKQKP